MQKYLSSCHKELDGHILRINISLQGYCKKKNLFLPQLEYMKELCFPPLRTCICTAANITDSLQGHAIMHVLYFGLEAHFADFSRMSFFHCQPLNYYRCTRKDRSDNLWKLDQCKGLTAFIQVCNYTNRPASALKKSPFKTRSIIPLGLKSDFNKITSSNYFRHIACSINSKFTLRHAFDLFVLVYAF